jgi:citrate synthase
VLDHLQRGAKLPGFGHPFHKPDDPRSPKLLQLAEEHGVKGEFTSLLLKLGRTFDARAGRHHTINATGAIAALFLEIGIPTDVFRGLALVSRCAGLLGHIQEERRSPTVRTLWKIVEDSTEYLDQER